MFEEESKSKDEFILSILKKIPIKNMIKKKINSIYNFFILKLFNRKTF
jgi:hypothetical protein